MHRREHTLGLHLLELFWHIIRLSCLGELGNYVVVKVEIHLDIGFNCFLEEDHCIVGGILDIGCGSPISINPGCNATFEQSQPMGMCITYVLPLIT